MSPGYLSDLLQFRKSSRSLRYVSDEVLSLQRIATKTYGDRAFSVFAPRLWNTLPFDICESSCVSAFKKSVTTCLFSKFVNRDSIYVNNFS